MFHLRFGLSDHLKALLDFVFGSRRRVKKVRIFRAWFSQIYLELTNERGQIFAIIHGTNLILQFSTTECILSLLFDPGRI